MKYAIDQSYKNKEVVLFMRPIAQITTHRYSGCRICWSYAGTWPVYSFLYFSAKKEGKKKDGYMSVALRLVIAVLVLILAIFSTKMYIQQVAGGHVDMALGGDQGGSIRMPAAACGIVGLKPTFGLVPYTGIISLELTLDHVGPMARTVYDTALLLEVGLL